VGGSCEHGNEPSGSIKGGEFLDRQLSDLASSMESTHNLQEGLIKYFQLILPIVCGVNGVQRWTCLCRTLLFTSLGDELLVRLAET
jgi:hypothetical protein